MPALQLSSSTAEELSALEPGEMEALQLERMEYDELSSNE